MPKITSSQRTEIIDLYYLGNNKAEIARMFNVSQQTIHYIVNPEKQASNARQKKANYSPEKNKVRKDRYLKRLKDKLKNKEL